MYFKGKQKNREQRVPVEVSRDTRVPRIVEDDSLVVL